MRYSYLEPENIKEAIAMLSAHRGEAKIIAGGTDLIPQMKSKVLSPGYVLDISCLPLLKGISFQETTGLRIGSMTTIREIERSEIIHERYVALAQAAGRLGSLAIRNVATIGGNLCNALPSADMVPPLIGFGASLNIIGPAGTRRILLENFFTEKGRSVCEAEEIVTDIIVPVAPSDNRAIYLKHSRTAIDLAVVGVSVVLTLSGPDICQEARVVLGAVAPIPLRARSSEEALRGRKLNAAVINEAAELAVEEARPITDVRATAEYRREIVGVLVRRALSQLLG